MSQTQLASMFLGNPLIADSDERLKGVSSLLTVQIHITDGQTGEILDYITAKNILEDNHKKSLEKTLETYDFITFANKRYAEYLEKRNRIIIPDEDDTLREFVIFESAKYRDSEGHKAQVFAHASYLELKKASILYPETYERTASQHMGFALKNTGWTVGTIEAEGMKTLIIDNHTNPYEFLRRIAREFDCELRFRVEHNGTRITGRYVDLLDRVGEWRGREVEFGKDLDSIRRIEKQDIVTALLGIGPEDEEGNRIETFVEDEDALQRWGRVDERGNLHHLIEPYEIQSERMEMTEEEARQYTRTALDKRINTQIEYEAMIIDLENVPGMENKKIRFGDTIKIKDTNFNPPLYLEARIFEQSRSIKSRAKKDIKLGDFVELTEDEVHDIWKQLRNQIRERVTAKELAEYTYNKLTIDNKDEEVRTDVESYANTVSSDAKDEAITYTNDTVEPIQVKVDDLEGEVDSHDTLISDAYTEINQAWDEIELKASQTDMDSANQRISNAEGSISTLAGEIELKASQTYVDAIEGRLETAEGELSVLPGEIELKANKDDVYTKTQVNARFDAVEGEIELKVDDGEARTIFLQEANSFTFGADQINFEGHIFGQGATFGGELSTQGADGTIVIKDDSIVSESNNPNLDGFVNKVEVSDGEISSRLLNPTTQEEGDQASSVNPNLIIFYDFEKSRTTSLSIDNLGFGDLLQNLQSVSVSDDDLMIRNSVGDMIVDTRNSIIKNGQLKINESGTSGGLALDSVGGEHYIVGHTSNGDFHIYPNRVSGENIFTIRSHENRSSYRNDFYIDSDSFMHSIGTRDNDSTASNNVRIGPTNARFYRTTSSSKFKLVPESAKVDHYKIFDLELMDWYDKNNTELYADLLTQQAHGKAVKFDEAEHLRRITGFLAEDVERVGLSQFVEYDSNQEIAGLQYDRLLTLLIPISKDHDNMLKDHDEEIVDLKADIDWLETENRLLKGRVEKLEKGA